MKTAHKILVVFMLAAAIVGTLTLKARQPKTSEAEESQPALEVVKVNTATAKPSPPQVARNIPKLVDLGADKCIPCKLMAPILEELKQEYAGKMEVQFIDVWKNPDAGTKFGVQVIPTQIFFDASGKELFRHTGFFGKEDILGKWKELGVEVGHEAE